MPLGQLKKAAEHYLHTRKAALGDPLSAIELGDARFYPRVVDTFIENWKAFLYLGFCETLPDEATQEINNHYFQAAFHLCSLAGAKEATQLSGIGTPSLTYNEANEKAKLICVSLELFPALPWALQNGKIHARETWMVLTRYACSLDENDAKKIPLKKIAFHLCMVEALDGNIRAQIDLGSMYRLGLGVEVNEVEAIKWLFPIAERGGIASVELGLAFCQQQDFKIAAHYFKQATEIATFAFVDGDIKLAKLYLYGLGVTQDTQKAIQLLNNANNKVGAPVEDKNLARAFLCLIENTMLGSDFNANTLSRLGKFILLNKKVLGNSQYADAIAKQNELLCKFQQFNAQASSSSSSSSTVLNQSGPVQVAVATETDRLLTQNNSSINRSHTYI